MEDEGHVFFCILDDDTIIHGDDELLGADIASVSDSEFLFRSSPRSILVVGFLFMTSFVEVYIMPLVKFSSKSILLIIISLPKSIDFNSIPVLVTTQRGNEI